MLLLTALDTDATLIPALVFGGFQGLRPDEFHGENVSERRSPLRWESVHWDDKRLDVLGKVRSKGASASAPAPGNRSVATSFQRNDRYYLETGRKLHVQNA